MKRIMAVILVLFSSELLAVVPPPCANNPEHPSCHAIKIHPGPEEIRVAAVPEPAPLLLIGSSVAGILLMRRLGK